MVTSSDRVVRYALAYPFDATYVINFKFWASAQIHAVLSFDDGTADLTLVESTDYSLSAPGATGLLTKVSDWDHDAVRLTIYREMDLDQNTDLRNGETVDLDLLETDLDYACARDQQIAETISRGVTVPITDEQASNELPGAGERASKFLGFDAVGVPQAVEGMASVPVTPFMATLLDDDDAAEALGTLGVDPYIQSLFNKTDAEDLKVNGLEMYRCLEVNGNTVLTNRTRHHVTLRSVVTLPTLPLLGDTIELEVSAYCRIQQSDAEHVISHRNWLFTTKGTTGFLMLKVGDHAKLIYKGSGFARQAPAKITDPATLPAGVGNGAAFSPDGRYLAVAHSTTPFVTIYDWNTGSPVKITDPATLPPAAGRGAAWSPDGRYLAIAHDNSPGVTIYDWNTGSPVKIANPATPLGGNGAGASWSPDGRYLACAHAGTPYVTIYDMITGTPTKITDPGTLPAGNAFGTAWSADGRYLAVAHTGSPYVTIYDWITGAPVKIADPATLPTATGLSVAWSHDGRYLAVGTSGTPFVAIYDLITGGPIKITNPTTLPTGNVGGAAWSPDGRYLAVAHATSLYVTIYDNFASATKAWMVLIDSMFGNRGIAHADDLRFRFK